MSTVKTELTEGVPIASEVVLIKGKLRGCQKVLLNSESMRDHTTGLPYLI